MDSRDGRHAVVELVDRGVAVAAWPLTRAAHPDLGLVDDLARLALAARRLGWSIRVRDPGDELCALLDLAGLADVAGLAFEPGRETERGEQAGVEEVVQRHEPPA